MAVTTSAPKMPGAASRRNLFLIYLHKVNSLLQTHTHTHNTRTSFLWARRCGGTKVREGLSLAETWVQVTRATQLPPAPSQASGWAAERAMSSGHWPLCVASPAKEGPGSRAKAAPVGAHSPLLSATLLSHHTGARLRRLLWPSHSPSHSLPTDYTSRMALTPGPRRGSWGSREFRLGKRW